MKTWPVEDAKARFSEFFDACLSEGPQMVTRRGAETAVLVPIAQWQQTQAATRSLKELLLSENARFEQATPQHAHERSKARRRPIQALD